MIIRNPLQLLENLSAVEEQIKIIEKKAEELGIEIDREKLIELILTRGA